MSRRYLQIKLLLLSCWNEMTGHKLRSFLTMLGIVVGIFTLVVSMGIMEGMFAAWKEYIEESGGLQKISVYQTTPPTSQAKLAGLSPGRTNRDVAYIENALGRSNFVSPEVFLGEVAVSFRQKQHNVRVLGVTPSFFKIDRYSTELGRLIGDLDVERFSRVAVLGQEPAAILFGGAQNAIGKVILIEGISFTVVGTVPLYKYVDTNRSSKFAYKNQIVMIPLSTAQKIFFGNQELSYLNISVLDIKKMPMIKDKMENVLLHTHYGIKDFLIATREQELVEWRKTEQSFSYGFRLMSIVCLLVGAIGIMNVMFASINERIREIGTRKALGANAFHIFIQILSESVILCVCAGAIGLGLSVVAIPFAGQIMPSDIPGQPVLVPQAMILGVVFSFSVGVLAGLIPAIRASRLDPVESLRHD